MTPPPIISVTYTAKLVDTFQILTYLSEVSGNVEPLFVGTLFPQLAWLEHFHPTFLQVPLPMPIPFILVPCPLLGIGHSQDSVPGTILFNLYIFPLANLIHS